jgi:hypothetical protein
MNRIGSAPSGVRGLAAGPVRAARLALCLFAALTLFSACSDDKSDPPFTNPPQPSPRNWLFDVNGTAANDVWACGAKGTMLHYDSVNWTAVNMATADPIVRMWKEDGGNRMFAVGHKGHIWRNTAGTWAAMASPTTENLYGIGELGGNVHAVGQSGTICRLQGESWSSVGGLIFELDEHNAPVDTLLVAEDIESLVCVNHYFLGGAYIDPNYTLPRVGIYGTRGGLLAVNDDERFLGEWVLRPLSGEQIVPHEWVLSMSSDPVDLSRNYLGASEGWLFRLTRDDDGKNVWAKFYPPVTDNPGAGINDIWVDADGNAYLVTDEGQVVYQTHDYDFSLGIGERAVIFDGVDRLTGIWGTSPTNLWVTGYAENKILHLSHDQEAGTATHEYVDVPFPDKAADTLGDRDPLGRPAP